MPRPFIVILPLLLDHLVYATHTYTIIAGSSVCTNQSANGPPAVCDKSGCQRSPSGVERAGQKADSGRVKEIRARVGLTEYGERDGLRADSKMHEKCFALL